jgi:hypothetical protein
MSSAASTCSTPIPQHTASTRRRTGACTLATAPAASTIALLYRPALYPARSPGRRCGLRFGDASHAPLRNHD